MTAELISHPGPEQAPAAQPGVGLWDEQCLRYTVPGSEAGPVSLAWPSDLVGSTVGPDSVLEWAVLPAFDHAAADATDGFRACATSLRVTFDDGSHLGDGDAPEVDGLASAAAERRGIDWPEQWNHRRLDLGSARGRRIEGLELIVSPGAPRGRVGEELVGWVDGPRLTVADALADSPAARALTVRGSHSSPARSRGLNAPLTGVPHGGCYLSPATQLDNQSWTYTWSGHGEGRRPELAGLLVTRAPSIWIGDRGALGIRLGLDLDADGRVAPEPFEHDDEVALPHRYSVATRSGIVVDAAGTSHGFAVDIDLPSAGFLSFTVPGGSIDHRTAEAGNGGAADELRIGLAVTTDNPYERDMRYFVSVHLGGADIAVVDGPEKELTLAVTPRDGERLRLEMGTSFISLAQADHTRSGLEGRSVDDVAAAAEEAWNEYLGLVEMPSSSVEDRRALASDLYRLFLYPTSHHEETPDGPRYADPITRSAPDGPETTGRTIREGRFLTDHGFWDTYRTCWPAFHLLAPARAGELIDGFLEHVRTSGWSARWSAGGPLDAMVGTSLDIVTSDAVLAGITGFDHRLAYDAALRNATCASPEKRFGRADMPGVLFRGWTQATIGESVSWTLEGMINDAGAAVQARELARTADRDTARRLRADARYLAGRAMDYDLLFDTATGFFRPRFADGTFADQPFDPRVWGGAHTETNAWGSRFGAPHDGVGLARLFGGRHGMGDALDALFAEPETARQEFSGSYGFVIHEMSEARDLRLGMCGLSNQPAHHLPWMYAFTDRPWRASEFTHEAASRLFLGMHIGQGFPGDEDNGEMSAWHMFARMGLWPLQVGSGALLIGAPSAPETRIHPIGAEPFVIRTRGDGGHVAGVLFNGEEWTSPTIGTARLHEGGELAITLSDSPVEWCEPMPSVPFFAPDDAPAVRWGDVLDRVDVDGDPRPALSDDEGAQLTRVGDGAVLGLGLSQDVPGLLQLAVTLDAPGRHDFAVEWSDGQGWQVAESFRDESWDWWCQTRPFDVVLPTRSRALRLRWSGDTVMRQIQVLAPR